MTRRHLKVSVERKTHSHCSTKRVAECTPPSGNNSLLDSPVYWDTLALRYQTLMSPIRVADRQHQQRVSARATVLPPNRRPREADPLVEATETRHLRLREPPLRTTASPRLVLGRRLSRGRQGRKRSGRRSASLRRRARTLGSTFPSSFLAGVGTGLGRRRSM